MSQSPPQISSHSFYNTYHGHPPQALQMLLSALPHPRLYLAGDSTLDNKYWVPFTPHSPPSSYASLLSPPQSRRDVAYWLNTLPSTPRFTAVNCAIEESTLRSRARELPAQDSVLAAHVTEDDVVVVSVGGNDVALAPTVRIAFSVLAATYLGAGWGEKALYSLFVAELEEYVRKLVQRCKPRLVVVCSLYYLDEEPMRCWAGAVLRLLGYNHRPERVQRVIRWVAEVMDEVRVEGVRVVVAPFFEALDGKDSGDYVERVEPSEEGGRKLAKLLLEIVEREVDAVPQTGSAERDVNSTEGK